MNIIAKALEEAVLRVADEVDKFASEGIGKDVMGPVLGRPEYEDLEIAIDSVCDRIFVERGVLKQTKYRKNWYAPYRGAMTYLLLCAT